MPTSRGRSAHFRPLITTWTVPGADRRLLSPPDSTGRAIRAAVAADRFLRGVRSLLGRRCRVSKRLGARLLNGGGCSAEEIAVRARSDEHHSIALAIPYEQPVGLDVAFPELRPLSRQAVRSVAGMQFVAAMRVSTRPTALSLASAPLDALRSFRATRCPQGHCVYSAL